MHLSSVGKERGLQISTIVSPEIKAQNLRFNPETDTDSVFKEKMFERFEELEEGTDIGLFIKYAGGLKFIFPQENWNELLLAHDRNIIKNYILRIDNDRYAHHLKQIAYAKSLISKVLINIEKLEELKEKTYKELFSAESGNLIKALWRLFYLFLISPADIELFKDDALRVACLGVIDEQPNQDGNILTFLAALHLKLVYGLPAINAVDLLPLYGELNEAVAHNNPSGYVESAFLLKMLTADELSIVPHTVICTFNAANEIIHQPPLPVRKELP